MVSAMARGTVLPYSQTASVRFGAPNAGLPLPSAPWHGAQFEKIDGKDLRAFPEDKDIPKDAWSRDFIYRFPGEHQADEPEIVSLGADGQPGGEGINADIVSWKNK